MSILERVTEAAEEIRRCRQDADCECIPCVVDQAPPPSEATLEKIRVLLSGGPE